MPTSEVRNSAFRIIPDKYNLLPSLFLTNINSGAVESLELGCFNINSGAVESLELDSFGIAIIPSSLVSTYALFVKDVLEVVSDAVIVHEAAASCIYRLTKGFLDNENAATSIDDIEDYSDFERPVESDKRSRRSSGNQKFRSQKSKTDDEWEPELPMDYSTNTYFPIAPFKNYILVLLH
ncbi:uncharacterized protein LOC112192466 [Rosa chinensis]|uniref:uncharacterized protein LOC112192466 n=1 Tax=Rosa chinensis TaxID=74649 RepID=UPI000D092E17|nr:uncharacterized protein LOC112192466 [Rosa chinensis]